MNRFLTRVMMLCLLAAGVASAETAAQPQLSAANTSKMEQQETNCATKNDVSSKEAKKQAKLARKREKEAQKRARLAAEPESTQEPVETGGGG